MPPVPQTVVPRNIALQYDGTNAADVFALVQQYYPIAPAAWQAPTQDEDGRLTIQSDDRDLWSDLGFPVGWYAVVTSGVQVAAVPAEVFADRYVVLP